MNSPPPLRQSSVGADQLWCRAAVVDADGTRHVDRTLQGPGSPDMAVVDEVARLALLAARVGARLVLRDVSPSMRELLDLAALPVEMQREPELGKNGLGVQEEAEPGDPAP
jgi:hypothetical protein